MEEERRGYELPYAADPGTQLAFIIIGLVGTGGVIWFARSEGIPLLLVFVLPFLAIVLYYAGQLVSRVHFVPEGIAVTLFGVTLRRLPAEDLRLIAAVRKYNNKATHHDVMALCVNTVEELTELGRAHTPKLLQNTADRWYGETAAKYLWRRAESFRGEFNLHRHMLWLDWSPERLRMLREMYPQAQWLDCTQKKLFDAQLKE